MALTVIYTLSTLKSEHGLNPNMDFSYKDTVQNFV